MKILLFKIMFVAGILVTNFASANTYKVDDAAVDQMFSSADDVTFSASEEAYALMNPAQTAVKGDKTVIGFLVRAWFCGGFALHRYYMGTGGKALFWYYFCIPVVGGVAGFVDFWWVVFKGEEAMNKYADNPKFLVWTGE